MVNPGFTGLAWYALDEDETAPDCIKVWVNFWDTNGFAWYERCSDPDDLATYPAFAEELFDHNPSTYKE